MSKVAVILADGMEEVEAVTPIDFLRRVGIEVITLGLSGKTVTGAHGIPVVADRVLKGFDWEVDGLVIPGGMPGAANIAADKVVKEIIREFDSKKKLVAAICAAPALVLGGAGILEGRKFTCFPGMESGAGKGGTYTAARVELDRHIITGSGPGSAAEFSAAIIAYLKDEKTARTLMEKSVQKGY